MINRTEWVSALSKLPAEQLLSVTTELSRNWTIRPKSLPQSGLGMLKLNDSAFEEPFYLGEFPLASAWLEITTVDGLVAEGAAQLMDDRVDIAEALAICDAVLSEKLPGWEKVSKLLDEGMEMIQLTHLERKQILASTQVSFSLLDDVGDNNVEA